MKRRERLKERSGQKRKQKEADKRERIKPQK
jgi:hypothetical protein